MSPVELVLATANAHKAAEITELLSGVADVLPRPPEVPEVEETGATLFDNARLKARALVAATGRPSVADDTGLEVEALGGAPGVYSARYAGEDASYADNVAKLLEALQGEKNRRACFRTVAVVAWPDGTELVAEGVVSGTITEAPRGRGGFGYDPVFAPDEAKGRTFAELAGESSAAKHRVSHRGRAFGRLATLLTTATP